MGWAAPTPSRDYFGVNPEFGDLDDLRHFVDAAHDLGMRVILDWVANHTAWDNVLVAEHPEWYARDWKGDFRPTPWWDWDDIIDLDYGQEGLRRYMTEAMKYWVREADIDGYRCDVAGFVPARLLGERPSRAGPDQAGLHARRVGGARPAHPRLRPDYAWSWNETMHRIAHGAAGPRAPCASTTPGTTAPTSATRIRMTFVSNHDKNAWEGTEYEQFGDALDAAIVLSVVGEGIPLVYNGQEAGSDKRLRVLRQGRDRVARGPAGRALPPAVRPQEGSTPPCGTGAGGRMVRVPNDQPSRPC